MEIQLNEEQQKIYNLVLNSKKSGITKANLAKNAGLNTKEVEKIIKTLENRDKIKSVRPNGRTTGVKLWIDFNQTLDSSLPTNVFRTAEQGVDDDLIERIKQKLIYFMQQQFDGRASLDEIRRVYKAQQSEHYDEMDFDRIIKLLQYDSILIEEENSFFKLNPFRQQKFQFYLSYLPCQTCPVFNQCKPGNTISPEKCIFEW
ncbi:unnamed protein product [Paramecium pentaurelia]|uniref:RNA polymerase III subunit C6 n=1 Tax=Paramecium pentaurelia TaxID=43138 RepID=A0A8S1SV39_9CILI|nr:unnamed protein product [Paramecium pentaurelia]